MAISKEFRLKPSTSYTFTEADLEFVLELSKVGHVHLLSSQVELYLGKDIGSNGVSFVDGYGSDSKCPGLTLPSGWVIEGIWYREKGVSVTFRVIHD